MTSKRTSFARRVNSERYARSRLTYELWNQFLPMEKEWEPGHVCGLFLGVLERVISSDDGSVTVHLWDSPGFPPYSVHLVKRNLNAIFLRESEDLEKDTYYACALIVRPRLADDTPEIGVLREWLLFPVNEVVEEIVNRYM